MCISEDTINRQWINRNHDVFGSIARRHIRAAIRRLRDEETDYSHAFVSRDEAVQVVQSVALRDDFAAVIFKSGESFFKVIISNRGYGYCRKINSNGLAISGYFEVGSGWMEKFVFSRYKNILEVH